MATSNFKSNLFVFFFLLSAVVQGQLSLNETHLLQTWKNDKLSDTLRLKALSKYIQQDLRRNNSDSILILADLGNQLALKSDNLHYQSVFASIKGNYYMRKFDLPLARKYHTRALTIDKNTKNYKGVIVSTFNLAAIEETASDFPVALSYYYEVIKLAEKIGDKAALANALNNMGNIYIGTKEIDTAGAFYKRSRNVGYINDSTFLPTLFMNLGTFYSEKNVLDSAIVYTRRSSIILRNLKDSFHLGKVYHNLGSVFSKAKNVDSAMHYLNKAIDIRKRIKDMKGLQSSLRRKAFRFYESGNKEEAVSYLLKALPIADSLNTVVELVEIHNGLYNLYGELNNYQLALKHLEIYKHLTDSIANRRNEIAMEKIKLSYEFDNRKLKLDQESQLKDLKSKRRVAISIFFLILSLLAGVALYLYYDRKKILNRKQIQQLEQSNLGLQMNPHFTFNAINSAQSFILSNSSEEAHRFLSDMSKLIRLTLNYSRDKTITLKQELDFLSLYISLEEQRIKDKISLVVKSEGNVDTDGELVPSLLLQPLIENSIWHGLKNQKGKCIEIDIAVHGDLLNIVVKDNGSGLKKENVRPNSKGLSIVQERIRLSYENEPTHSYFVVENESSTGFGTKITITLPHTTEF